MLNAPLSSKAEYALVAMLDLAMYFGDPAPIPLRKIAERHELKSEQFLVQVLLQLKIKGLVVSTRGANGGYHLAREPEKISFWQVLEAIDSTNLSGSLAAEQDEVLSPSVFLQIAQKTWHEANLVRRLALEKISLRDLLEKVGATGIPNYQI